MDYLKKARPKRSITAKKIENYQATNIIEKQVKNNTKCENLGFYHIKGNPT
jgi:hypothetical protein